MNNDREIGPKSELYDTLWRAFMRSSAVLMVVGLILLSYWQKPGHTATRLN